MYTASLTLLSYAVISADHLVYQKHRRYIGATLDRMRKYVNTFLKGVR